MASTSGTPPTVLIIDDGASTSPPGDTYRINAADLENSNITARISNVPFRKVIFQMPADEVFVNNERVIGFRSLIVLSDKTEIILESDARVNGDPFQKYGLYRRDVNEDSYSPVELSSTLLQDRRHWVDSIGRTNLRKLRHLVEVNGAAHDKFSLEIQKYASKNDDFLTESRKKLFALGDSIKNALKDEIEGKISNFQDQHQNLKEEDKEKLRKIETLQEQKNALDTKIRQLRASLDERDAITLKQKQEIDDLLSRATAQAEKFSKENQTILDLLETQEAEQLKLLTLSDQRTRDIEELKDEISRQRLDGPPVEENELGITIVIGNDFEHVLDDDGGGGDDGAPGGPPRGEGAGDEGGAPRRLFGGGLGGRRGSSTSRGSKQNTIEPPSKSGGGDKGGASGGGFGGGIGVGDKGDASGGDGTESKLLDSKPFEPRVLEAEIKELWGLGNPRATFYFIARTMGSGENAKDAETIKKNIDLAIGRDRKKFDKQYYESDGPKRALEKFNLKRGRTRTYKNLFKGVKDVQTNVLQSLKKYGIFIKAALPGASTFVYKDKQDNRLVSYNSLSGETTDELSIEYYVKALENSEFLFVVGRPNRSTVKAFIGGVPGFYDDKTGGYMKKPQPATYGHNVNAEYIFDTRKSMDNIRAINTLIYAVCETQSQYFELQKHQVPQEQTFLLPYSDYLFEGTQWKLRLKRPEKMTDITPTLFFRGDIAQFKITSENQSGIVGTQQLFFLEFEEAPKQQYFDELNYLRPFQIIPTPEKDDEPLTLILSGIDYDVANLRFEITSLNTGIWSSGLNLLDYLDEENFHFMVPAFRSARANVGLSHAIQTRAFIGQLDPQDTQSLEKLCNNATDAFDCKFPCQRGGDGICTAMQKESLFSYIVTKYPGNKLVYHNLRKMIEEIIANGFLDSDYAGKIASEDLDKIELVARALYDRLAFFDLVVEPLKDEVKKKPDSKKRVKNMLIQISNAIKKDLSQQQRSSWIAKGYDTFAIASVLLNLVATSLHGGLLREPNNQAYCDNRGAIVSLPSSFGSYSEFPFVLGEVERIDHRSNENRPVCEHVAFEGKQYAVNRDYGDLLKWDANTNEFQLVESPIGQGDYAPDNIKEILNQKYNLVGENGIWDARKLSDATRQMYFEDAIDDLIQHYHDGDTAPPDITHILNEAFEGSMREVPVVGDEPVTYKNPFVSHGDSIGPLLQVISASRVGDSNNTRLKGFYLVRNTRRKPAVRKDFDMEVTNELVHSKIPFSRYKDGKIIGTQIKDVIETLGKEMIEFAGGLDRFFLPSPAPVPGPQPQPSNAPSTSPSRGPSTLPSTSPSNAPSTSPSNAPSRGPTPVPQNAVPYWENGGDIINKPLVYTPENAGFTITFKPKEGLGPNFVHISLINKNAYFSHLNAEKFVTTKNLLLSAFREKILYPHNENMDSAFRYLVTQYRDSGKGLYEFLTGYGIPYKAYEEK